MEPSPSPVGAIPAELRDVAVREFLPEILHDLNNECAVLDGSAVLLKASPADARKVVERASAIEQASAGCERIACLAGAVAVALGAPMSPVFRDDALPAFLEVAASAIRRQGGTFEGELPARATLRDPVAALVLAAAVREFAGRGSVDVHLRVVGSPVATGFHVETSAGDASGRALLEEVARSLGCEVRVEAKTARIGLPAPA
ncbi:MAG TPA: hypothetical protein VKE69_05970 [Planctomycetota bacterium]|nr:hypothetical protein [Planctomycetota bacterium]